MDIKLYKIMISSLDCVTFKLYKISHRLFFCGLSESNFYHVEFVFLGRNYVGKVLHIMDLPPSC